MNGNCDRLGWDFVQVCEPALADLLRTGGRRPVLDNQVGIFGLEIGGWVVERQVTVLADARKGEMIGEAVMAAARLVIVSADGPRPSIKW